MVVIRTVAGTIVLKFVVLISFVAFVTFVFAVIAMLIITSVLLNLLMIDIIVLMINFYFIFIKKGVSNYCKYYYCKIKRELTFNTGN